jgi:5'-deoxynucleotidase YfbR-like HD superfamily hydrolase
MKIAEIYEKFNIPRNLQEHMIRAAKMCQFICDHWRGKEIDKDIILKGALLHDLGNIVKFDLVKYPKLLGKEKSRVEFWKEVQKKTTEKYGSDDHEVTRKMLEEIGVDDKLKNTVLKKGFANSLETEKSDDWEVKMLFYCDLRAGPFGVMPLKERLSEALPRLEKYKHLGNLDDFVKACENIEKQIQDNLDTDVFKITEEKINESSVNFQEIEI